MLATLLHHEKYRYDDGSILEMKVWQVPNRVTGSQHGFKYSLFYGRNGVRLIGYDNESGKGDHRHLNGRETPYTFVSIRQLMADFLADVAAMRPGEMKGSS